MGMETEYGFSALAPTGRPISRDTVLAKLHAAIPQLYPALPVAFGNGYFTANGARLYFDCGHPEFCTPEVTHPLDVVRYALAGDLMWGELTGRVAQESPQHQFLLFKTNVDYAQNATWACHESYGHRANPTELPDQLIPHLVSRILYTGAGGFHPASVAIAPVLSPRVFHLEQAVGDSSTSNRSIFHTKNEALARDWHRLHVLSGECLCSHTATYLKFGTTALVLALAEAGLNPGADVRLVSPVEAIRRFSSDLTLRATALTTNHRRLTALDIQRHYLESAERHSDHPGMPAWAPQVRLVWRDILDRLAQGPQAVNRSLDWAMKLDLYSRHAAGRGFQTEALADWRRITEALAAAHRATGTTEPFSVDLVLSSHSPLQPEVTRLSPELQAHGLAWEQFPAYLNLMLELCELDIHFSQVWPPGLFHQLDQLPGLLAHRSPELNPAAVQRAVTTAPDHGRAHLRGSFVRDHAAQNQYRCDWHVIHNGAEATLDLSDPFRCEMPPWTTARPLGAARGRRLDVAELAGVLFGREATPQNEPEPIPPPQSSSFLPDT